MGTLIGLPTYKHTMDLMRDFDLMDRGPLLERGFLIIMGEKLHRFPWSR